MHCSTILKPNTIFYLVWLILSLLYFLSISLFFVCWRRGFAAMVDGFLDQQQQDQWWFFCGFFLVVASRCCGGFAWWWPGFFSLVSWLRLFGVVVGFFGAMARFFLSMLMGLDQYRGCWWVDGFGIGDGLIVVHGGGGSMWWFGFLFLFGFWVYYFIM